MSFTGYIITSYQFVAELIQHPVSIMYHVRVSCICINNNIGTIFVTAPGLKIIVIVPVQL